MKNSEKAKHLVQGSVWVNKKGRQYTVLAVSNISVHENENSSERQLETFPLCVIFLNSENDVFSLDVDKFIKVYEYDSDNENVDICMNNVFDANVGKYKPEDVEEIAVEDIEIDASSEEDLESESDIHKFKTEQNEESVEVAEEKPVIESATESEVKLPFDFESNGEPFPIMIDELKTSLCGYSEYVDGTGNHFHKFLFTPSENVTIKNLRTAFDPEVKGAYYSAVINYSEEPISIEWNTLCNVTVEYHNSGVQIVVIVANENEFAAVDAIEPNEESVEPSAVNENLANIAPSIVSSGTDLPTEAPIEVVDNTPKVTWSEAVEGIKVDDATISDNVAEKIAKEVVGE